MKLVEPSERQFRAARDYAQSLSINMYMTMDAIARRLPASQLVQAFIDDYRRIFPSRLIADEERDTETFIRALTD